MSVAVLTDSVADLPSGVAEALGIRVVPYNVHWGQNTCKDGIDLAPAEFYGRLSSDTVLPTTSCPSAGDYEAAYASLLKSHESIVSLHITAKGSGAYQAACIGREMLPGADITPIDTCSVSMGAGYMAIEAARTARAGGSRDEVLGVVRKLMAGMYQVYAADTLKFLYLGGRIGRAKHMLGSILNLKPLITMDRDGVIGPVGQAISRQGVLRRIVELVGQWSGGRSPLNVALVEGAAEQDIAKLKRMVESEFRCSEVLLSQFGPALGVHTGPGTVGLIFFPAAVLTEPA